MFPRPVEVKRALADELTKVISKHCKITDDHTWIVFEDVPREHWAQGGKLMSEK
jgi:phenylpyruvate tautomerase PptA (4-oxalocrotonate tautomerase family)